MKGALKPIDREPDLKAPVFEAGDEKSFLVWGMGWGETVDSVRRTYYTDIDERYIHEQQSVHHILYHIIFCPKRRQKVLVGPVHDRLKRIIEQVAHEQQCQMERVAIQPAPFCISAFDRR